MSMTGQAQLQRQANTTLTLPANLPTASGYITEDALEGLRFAFPICVRSQPGRTDRLFVVERNSGIQLVDLSTSPPTKTTFLNLSAFLSGQVNTSLATDGECGFLSMAFHPNYATNGLFYVFYSCFVNGSRYQRVARFKAAGANPVTATSADTATHRVLISQFDEASNHNGGDLHFGVDGFLYISVGDEGGGNDQFDNARFIDRDFFGALLRIDVDEDTAGNVVGKPGSVAPHTHPAVMTGTYLVPGNNPFLNAATHHGQTIADPNTVRTEIWATGLRNPFRFSIDRPTGRVFVADVGQNAWEEVDIVTAGADCGWSWREGTHPFTQGPGPTTPPATGFNPLEPIYDYAHGSGTFQGNSITGGLVYRGTRLTEMFEKYIFADYVSNHVWALRKNGTAWSAEALCDSTNVVAFGEDPRNGDVLLCNIGSSSNPPNGVVSRLVRSGTTGTPLPAFLSQTGAFSNLTTLTPNAGIVPYAPNVDFWSDYAVKSRWFSIKNLTDKMAFSADGNWTFPTGQVWVKHFDLPVERTNPNGARKRIETRFLVKTASNVYGITYKWNSGGTDAELVTESGEDATITGLTINGATATQTWRYPSRSECLSCHTAIAGGALSFNTRQLNVAHVYGTQTQNQIQALSDAGYLTSAVPGVNNLPRFFRANESTQSLESRVRSYLAVNCVQCHQPGGAALGNWDARPTTPTDSANLVNGALVDTLGDSANRFAKPGDLAHSMVFRRVRGTDAPRMPPLATHERDPDAETLLTQWIQQELPTRRSFPEWQVQYFGSTSDPNAAAGADFDGDGRSNLQEWLENTDPKNANSAWTFSQVAAAGGVFQLSFTHPANRSALVEISTDLLSWTIWDVPGNQPSYPATAHPVTLSTPFDAAEKFFRVRLAAP